MSSSMLLGLVAVAGQAWAQPATLNTPVLQIPCDTVAGTLVVLVRIGDSRELRCVLDTGMPEGAFLFDPALGRELGLKYVGTAAVTGTGAARRTASVALGTTLRIGDIELAGERVIVLDEAGLLAGIGADGAIGASLFNRYVVEMDIESSIVSLYAPEGFDCARSGEAVELSLADTRPSVNATVSVDGETSVPVRLVVDTGATRGLSLNKGALALPEKTIPTIQAGVGGNVPGVVGRVSSLRLGSLELTGLVGQFPDEPARDADGTLGMDVLSRFAVTVDYPNRRLLLRRNASFGEPFEYNMAGLLLLPIDGGRLKVYGVIDDSPAHGAGIRANDVVVAINGRRLDDVGDANVRRLFKQQGATIVLTLDREGERIEVTMQLARLI